MLTLNSEAKASGSVFTDIPPFGLLDRPAASSERLDICITETATVDNHQEESVLYFSLDFDGKVVGILAYCIQ